MAGGAVMGRSIAKNLRWEGCVSAPPCALDLPGFFPVCDGLRLSAHFAGLLPWLACARPGECPALRADCLSLRRDIRQARLRKELPLSRAFAPRQGLCLLASLLLAQAGGRGGWLRVDGGVNVFLLGVGGQPLAVSACCLDDSGGFFLDAWWPLLDLAGPLRAGDRVFSATAPWAASPARPRRPARRRHKTRAWARPHRAAA